MCVYGVRMVNRDLVSFVIQKYRYMYISIVFSIVRARTTLLVVFGGFFFIIYKNFRI